MSGFDAPVAGQQLEFSGLDDLADDSEPMLEISSSAFSLVKPSSSSKSSNSTATVQPPTRKQSGSHSSANHKPSSTSSHKPSSFSSSSNAHFPPSSTSSNDPFLDGAEDELDARGDADDMIYPPSTSSPKAALQRYQPSTAAAPSSLASSDGHLLAARSADAHPDSMSAFATSTAAHSTRQSLVQSKRFVESVASQLNEHQRQVARVKNQLDKEERSLTSLQQQEQTLLRQWEIKRRQLQQAEAEEYASRQARAEQERAASQTKWKQNQLSGGATSSSSSSSSPPSDSTSFATATAPQARQVIQLEQQIAFVRSLLANQQNAVHQQMQALRLAERERDLVLMHNDKLEDTKVALRDWQEREGAHARSVGAEQHQQLSRVAKMKREVDQLVASRVARDAQLVEQQYQKQDEDGNRALHATAIRMADYAKHTQELRQQVDKVIDKEYQERAEAILSLKGSIRDATTELITSNERRAKQRAKKVEAQAAERADIKAAGGNPDAVFRERAAQQEIVQIQKQRQDKYRETEVHLLDKVLYEQSRKHADQVAAEKVKQTEREYLANVGKEVVDRKRADYMKSRTIGQKELVDPTGRMPHLFPSHHTSMKDWKFGLGLSTSSEYSNILAREQAKYPDVSTSTWLVPQEMTEEEARARLNLDFGGTLSASSSRPATVAAASSSASGVSEKQAEDPKANPQSHLARTEVPHFPAFPGTSHQLPRPDAEEKQRQIKERALAAKEAAIAEEKRKRAEKEAARVAMSGAGNSTGFGGTGVFGPELLSLVGRGAETFNATLQNKLSSSMNQQPQQGGGDEADGYADGDDEEQNLTAAVYDPENDPNWRPAKPAPPMRARDGNVAELLMTQHEKAKVKEATHIIHERLMEGEQREVCGKVYGGSKFLASPAEIVFEDFEIGVPMEQTIILTNVSFAFNHFKLLDLPPTISDFFEIIYTRPGRMSAGLTCSIRIIFRPERYEDIVTGLPFLAETGPFSIPLKAFTKKLVVSLNPRSLIDFGVVVQGEEKMLEIQVKNEGGLDAEISLTLEAISVEEIERERSKLKSSSSTKRPSTAKTVTLQAPLIHGDEGESTDQHASTSTGDKQDFKSTSSNHQHEHVDPLANPESAKMITDVSSVHPMLTLPVNPYINAYSGTKLPIKFHPMFVSSFQVYAIVTFRPVNPYDLEMEKESQVQAASITSSSSGAPAIYVRRSYPAQTFRIRLTGVSAPVPIYLERTVLDYQSILHGRLYRDVLHVHNRSQRTLQINCAPPVWCGECLTCEPPSAYVQARELVLVQWRLNTNENFWKQAMKWGCFDREAWEQRGEPIVVIEMQVNVPEQRIPVLFTLRAHLNNPELEIIPMQLPVPPASRALGLLTNSASSDPSSSSANDALSSRPASSVNQSRPGIAAVSVPPAFPSNLDPLIDKLSINFGKCFLSQSTVVPVQIKNHSSLIQRFAFTNLPKDIDAQPQDGMVTLLPFTSAVRNLVFAPTAAVERTGDVVIHSSLGKEYRIKVQAEGIDSPIKFSHTLVKFPPCADQQEQLASVFVHNTHPTQTYWLEFAPTFSPDGSDTFLRVTPTVLSIPPVQRSRVQVEFMPKLFPLEEIPKGGHSEPVFTELESQAAMAKFQPLVQTQSMMLSRQKSSNSMRSPSQMSIRAPSSMSMRATSSMSMRSNASTSASNHDEAIALSPSELRDLQARFLPPLETLLSIVEKDQSKLPVSGSSILSNEAGNGNVEAMEATLPCITRYAMPAVFDRIHHRRQHPEEAQAEDDQLEKERAKEKAKLEHLHGEHLDTARSASGLGDASASGEAKSIDDVPAIAPAELPSARPLSPSTLARAEFPYLSFSRHSVHRLACHVTPDPATVVPTPVYLQVETCTVLPRLFCEPRQIDFGQIAIGRADTVHIKLRNLDAMPMTLSAEPLPLSSPFTIMSALRPIVAGGTQTMLLEFRPKAEQLFNEEIVIRSAENNTQLLIKITGRGVAPKVELQPPGPVIDIGDAMAGDTISSTFTIFNRSVFPLPFEIVTKANGEKNLCGLDAFHFVPGEGIVPPEQNCVVTVNFSPDHQSEHFWQQVKVEVPNGDDRQLLRFEARGWDRQMYVLGDDSSPFKLYSVPPTPGSSATATERKEPAPAAQPSSSSSKNLSETPTAIAITPAEVTPIRMQDAFTYLQWDDLLASSSATSSTSSSIRQLTVTFDPAAFAESKENQEATAQAAGAKKDPKAAAAAGEERSRQLILGACKAGGDPAFPNVLMLTTGGGVGMGSAAAASGAKDAKKPSAPDPKAAAAGGSFAFELTSEAKTDGFFVIEPATGNAQAGQRVPVNIKFNVSKYRATRTSIVSQWVQTKIKVTLKGGLASNGKAEEVVEIFCRVYME